MSQNRKRPVTYGKSPLNRLEPYMPGLGNPRVSASRASPADEPAISASYPPKPSVRPFRPSRPPKTSCEYLVPLIMLICSSTKVASPSPSKEGDERSVMQQKRRKLLHEGARRDPTRIHMTSNASVGGNLEDIDLRDNSDLLSKISRRDSAQDGSDISRSPSSGTSSKAKSLNRPASSFRRSTRRQQPTSQPQVHDYRGSGNSMDTSQKIKSASMRRRLVDSLGAADEDSEVLTPVSGDAPQSVQLSHSVADEARSTPAHWLLTRKQSESGTRDPERLQKNSAAPIPSTLRSSGVTYSRQRSFLNDSLSLTDYYPHGMGNSDEFQTRQERLNVRSPCTPPEDDDSHDIKPARSIHELRQAGDNARFREVVDSIFEDIEDSYNSRSGRCCGLAELCGKLLDSQFVHRFSEQGFDERLVNCTSNSLDIVSASLALGAHRLIITGGHASRIFSESLWARILELSPLLLDIEDDLLVLARKPSIGLSKTAQASIRGIRSHLLSAIGSPSPCLSPRLLALECTKSSLIVLRESGHTVHPVSTSLLGKLVDLLAVSATRDRNAPPPRYQLQSLNLVFSILENYSVISGSFDCNHCRCFHRLSHLHNLLSLDHHDRSRLISMSYIRVILNLTNKEPTLCDSFATPGLVSGLVEIVTREFCGISRDICDQDNITLNEVILALGTLINLAEKTDQSRSILMSSNDRTAPFLHKLLEQFSSSVSSMDQAHSVPEVHRNVVAGYLSILLLTICLDKEARLQVKTYLNGGGLALILSTAEKFLQYHREVEKDTRLLDMWEQGESRFTARLAHIIDQIRQLEDLANEVH
ncbi:wings apart-like protein regulation of heterochromatin-domain-containing protein [Aspergillus varians]